MAVDLLLDPNIPLVTITGKAGTGKTLLTVAAGLQQVVENNIYKKMLVSRPVVPMGKDIGYLPGTIEDKLNPWMQPIFDNLEFLMDAGSDSRRGQGSHKSQALIDQGFIQVEPLMYIRGRSIPNQFFVLDESQNLSKHEIKTILSRVGDGTKIILTGDPDQIDSPHLDKVSCGLSQVVEIFKGSPLAGHITLSKGERSQLAEAVVELFK
jgi:PhoH-like ATPase